MTNRPTGTVTFVFTDIEGSTQRWEHDRAGMSAALVRHNAILERAFAAHAGYVFHTAGDAYASAFAQANDALEAAIDAQRALALERWDEVAAGFEPLRVRMGVHTGLAELKDGDYFGRPLNRTARLMAAGHGGQVLVSLATEQLVRDALPDGAKLVDLGIHRLRDLEHTEHLFRLTAPGFPDVATPPDTTEALPTGTRAHVDVDALPAECPYRGLFAFREEDAPYFFGRESFTELLVESAAAAPMVGVIGPSGSGKSSVVFAGLVPRLRQAGNGNGHWTVLEMRPGSRPYHALAGILAPLVLGSEATEIDRLAEINKLADYFRAGTVSPGDVLTRIADKHPDLGRLLLVADQFEELYTLCPDEADHRGFQDLLFAAAFDGNGGTPLTLALTLRADFMGHALAYRPFADAIQRHDVKLGPMTRDELGRAIRLPAEKHGRVFETGLVERIMDDVGEKAGTLPLLEFALTKLWEQQDAGWLTHEAYEAIGRVEGAVARHADTVYARLAEPEQERARRVFVQLVQPGEGTEDTRRLATHDELATNWPLVQRLADARLVTTSRDEAGRETAEVVHEALIRSWQRLREWMSADRRFRTWQERLRFSLRQWEASGRDEGALLRGVPLGEAEGWLAERGGEMTAGERAYVAAGVELRERREAEREAQRQRELAVERARAEEQAAAARTLRRRAILLATAMAASIVLGIAALLSRQQAARDGRIAHARELAAAALASLDSDPERSTLLALQAISVTQPVGGIVLPEVETVLHRSVAAMHLSLALGHELGVSAARYSPDGTRIATASADKTAKVWDATSGRLLQTLAGHTARVSDVAFSPDGTRITTASADKTAKVWDAATGRLLQTLAGHTDRVFRVTFSPDGTRIATVSDDKTAKVWDAATGRLLQTLAGHTDRVSDSAFSPDGTRIATASYDKTAKVWDAATGRLMQTLAGHTDQVFRVTFSPDGTRIATASRDKTAKVWDAATGRLMQTLAGHTNQVSHVVFNPDGTRIATASLDKTAKVWDAYDGRELHTLARHDSGVWCLAFSPDGRSLATGSGDKKIMVWDVLSGNHLRTLTGHTGIVNSLVISPNGLHVLSAAYDDVKARVWDLTPDHEVLALFGELSSDVAFSPDGQWFATAPDKTAVLHDATTGREIRRFVGHTADVLDVDFSPDGRRLATAGSDDNTARVWDTSTGRSLVTLCCHDDYVQQVTFSPDGKHVATASYDKTAKVWDADTGHLLQTLAGHTDRVHAVVYSPDGRYLATVSDDNTAKLWDAATGKLVRTFIGHTGPINYAWFSPDGQRLATASSDDSVGIWEVATGLRRHSIDGLMGGVNYVAYTPDGSMLIGVGSNGQAKVWQSETGALLFTLAGEGSNVVALAVSTDGGRLLMNSNAGTGIYLLRLPDLIALARARLTRTLTPEECRQYLHVDACPADVPRPARDGRRSLGISRLSQRAEHVHWDASGRPLAHSTGGCHPAVIQRSRARTSATRLSRSSATVARPDAVTPSTIRPLSIHWK